MKTPKILRTYSETIICPECELQQSATVEIVDVGIPMPSCVHTCTGCGYVIMESEWNEVNPQTKCTAIDEDLGIIDELLNPQTQTK